MENKVKIIATIGPSSGKKEILEKLRDKGVDFFRINLSHTNEQEIAAKIKELKQYDVPIILDTEGHQIRSGNINEIEFKEGDNVRIHQMKIECNSKNLFFNPPEIIGNLKEGDLIFLGFNSVLLKVFDTLHLQSDGYLICKVLIGGLLGSKKAVVIDSPGLKLFSFSKKDMISLDLAKKYKIRHFTLSFMESEETVKEFRSLYPEAIIYSKIESKKGLENFIEIARESDGILIDRGDLSNQVPIEKLPFIQKYLIKKCREMGKEIFIATNTLEDMASYLKPNRAEVNDIINTILDGVTGFALTKEIAVGKYPAETVNMINTLIKQSEFLNLSKGAGEESISELIEKSRYLYSENVPGLLIKPHGGALINRVSGKNYNQIELPKKRIIINEETLMDAEQIAIGSFSPLEGFLGEKDFNSVVENMRLSNGIVWPIPIILSISEEDKNRLNLSSGEDVSLVFEVDNEVYAIFHLDEIYKINKQEAARKIYGTLDISHPGVRKFMLTKENLLGGKITLLKRRESLHRLYELTPRQTRKIFAERGWSKVLGFHTRNVIHKSHEFIQLEGLRKSFCDGLFIHPIIGKKKSGDFEANVIINAYEKMIDSFYPKSKVLLCSLATFSRYAGPREAIFTALVRKNFGCSHFIVGRDHTGVKDFYHPKASHEIFDKFSQEELGITAVKFDKVFYSALQNRYLHEPEHPNHPEDKKMHISGTQAREMLKTGQQPPEWFMRPEISQIILGKVKQGEKVFVEDELSVKKTRVVWLTGLSGSGKTRIANLFKEKLESSEKKIKIFDGDVVRSTLHKNLGFTPEDIKQNNWLIATLCKKNLPYFDYILVPIISPFRESRRQARQLLGENFIEVFVNCPLEECVRRDVKGLYKKSLSGEIPNFIGVSPNVPYEPPENPHLILNTDKETEEQALNKLLAFFGIR